MHTPELRGLLAFAEVVQSQSFSGAAARLGITKSAVSKLVAQTESSLGVQLLVRTTRKLSVTEVGEAVYAACARLEDDLDAVRQAVAPRAAVVGHLRVTAPAVLGRVQLAPLVAEFLAQNPRVTLDLSLSDHFVDVLEQRIDVALRVRQSFADSSLVVRKLAKVRIVIAAAPDYLSRAGTPTSPSELASHSVIAHAPAAQPGQFSFKRRGKSVNVRFASRLTCNDGAAMVGAAIAGHGVVAAPDFEISEAVASGKLVPLLAGWDMEPLVLAALFPQQRYVPTKVRAFIDFIAERWKKPPWAV